MLLTYLLGGAAFGDKIRGTCSPGVQSRQAVRPLANIRDYEGATRQEGVSEPSILTDEEFLTKVAKRNEGDWKNPIP